MNVYWCELPMRTVGMSTDPPDPGEPVGPCGYYVAETRGQAKLELIREWAYPHDHWPGAAEAEEFVDVRRRLLARGIDLPRGPMPEPPEGPWDEDDDVPPPDPWETVYARYFDLLQMTPAEPGEGSTDG